MTNVINDTCRGNNSIPVPPEVARICCDSRYSACPRRGIIKAGAVILRLCILPAGLTGHTAEPRNPFNAAANQEGGQANG